MPCLVMVLLIFQKHKTESAAQEKKKTQFKMYVKKKVKVVFDRERERVPSLLGAVKMEKESVVVIT